MWFLFCRKVRCLIRITEFCIFKGLTLILPVGFKVDRILPKSQVSVASCCLPLVKMKHS